MGTGGKGEVDDDKESKHCSKPKGAGLHLHSVWEGGSGMCHQGAHRGEPLGGGLPSMQPLRQGFQDQSGIQEAPKSDTFLCSLSGLFLFFFFFFFPKKIFQKKKKKKKKKKS